MQLSFSDKARARVARLKPDWRLEQPPPPTMLLAIADHRLYQRNRRRKMMIVAFSSLSLNSTSPSWMHLFARPRTT
ncbi:hypothetical protein L596_022257 [Steinernema carpocapsae]|uniref:Uncharacterized protein n=1 Tax=Steinernema carpocapsae TaxID=34508 RepID=A0A4V6A056_STECR|nr:hypothetical protein L596_022257 [Steinernema carpocapsae]